VISVKYELHNIFFRHFWQLLGKDVLQVNQLLHTLMSLVIPHTMKRINPRLFQLFYRRIPLSKANAQFLTVKTDETVVFWFGLCHQFIQ